MAEWTCESCVHYPPSSFSKSCTVCDPDDPLLNRYEKREEPVITKDYLIDISNYHAVTNIQTNADRIRAMSDEELAAEMSVRLSEDCLMCPVLKADCPVWERKDIECGQAMLEWLQSTAGGDGDG